MADSDAAATATQTAGTELSRDLRLFDITMVGVGAMIGAGIFALTGIAAGVAGPGLILAFALNGVLTMCTAMVYAEIGSAIPGAGGGYLWSKFGLPDAAAFLAGWMDWLAHAVAGSLYAVIFGAYAVWGLQTILGWGTPPTGEVHGDAGTLFGVDAVYFAKGLTLAVCLLFIYVNYRGSSETGKVGNIITVSKIIAIAIFIAFGVAAMIRGGGVEEGVAAVPVAAKFAPFLPEGFSGVLVGMGLTFIAFEGYEIIVQAGEEVVDPRRNIPKAVFWSLAIVIPIYILVAIVCIGALAIPSNLVVPVGPFEAGDTWAYLAALGETGVAEAANQFMPWGTGAILLVIGALLSTMSALNATTYSSTRVSFAMGRDRNLPAVMASVSPKTRTPVAALLASGGLITVVALFLDAEKVAAATCVMFLLVFIGVNVAAIMVRRKYGDKMRYGYVMPLFPLIPIIAIIGQLAVVVFLLIHEPLSLYLTAGWIGIGLVIYYTYSRRHEHEHKASPVVLEQRAAIVENDHRVLVPVANPAHAGPLVDLGARLARAGDGALMVLHVVAVPEQLPYAAAGRFVAYAKGLADGALEMALATGVPAVGLVRVAHHPARSIVDTIIDRECQTLVLGWRGPKLAASGPPDQFDARRARIGSQIDYVLTRADADTVVIRGELPPNPRSVLIPVANPRQGRFAVKVAEAVAGPDTTIRLMNVARTREEAAARGAQIMEAIFDTDELETTTETRSLPVTMNAVVATSVARALYKACDSADVVIVGAAVDTWLHRIAFTRFHYDLARYYDGPLLLVRLRSGRPKFALQSVVDFFRSREPR
ncbi:MAG: amino acid permease [Planctomycetes bacterium]|nr:amino acid permease [Planctomycetota bacterium]